MKVSTAAMLLLSALQTVAADSERTVVSVQYEYQLEVDDIKTIGNTRDVLSHIDSDILQSIQLMLPNGATKRNGELPNVLYASVNSEIFSACFTESEECALVRSDIEITHEGGKPDFSVEIVTLRLVQQYISEYNAQHEKIGATYMFPSIVSTLTQFQVNPVPEAMSKLEIKVFEDTFLEVFGAIVFAIEGDTEILDARFVYQDLIENRRMAEEEGQIDDGTSSSNFTENNVFDASDDNSTVIDDDGDDEEEEEEEIFKNYTLQTDLQVPGVCRECDSVEFGSVVNNVIWSNIESFRKELQRNGLEANTTYFDNVTSIIFSVPELPVKLPPIEDESIFDNEPPVVEKTLPWFLYVGVSMAILIVCLGGLFIAKDRADMEKEEGFSTGASDEEGDSNAESEDGDEDEYDDDDDQDQDEDDDEADLEEGVSGDEDGTYEGLDDYQVETIAQTEDGDADGDGTTSNYEVYL